MHTSTPKRLCRAAGAKGSRHWTDITAGSSTQYSTLCGIFLIQRKISAWLRKQSLFAIAFANVRSNAGNGGPPHTATPKTCPTSSKPLSDVRNAPQATPHIAPRGGNPGCPHDVVSTIRTGRNVTWFKFSCLGDQTRLPSRHLS